MARTFLPDSRVASLDELETRILEGIDETKARPVPFQWMDFALQMTRMQSG